MSPLTLLCPAKLNLALSVGAPASDGFHPVASAMLALSWGDSLSLQKAEKTTWQRAWAPDAPKPSDIDWPEEKDLAIRAHRLLEESAGRALPVEAQLSKRIPTGAGLGGGSSDAAATLVGLNRLFDLRLPTEALAELGAKLGSDVAFFVHALSGSPLAVATGRGEKLEPAPLPQPLADAYFVLIFPHSLCATPAVYKTFDRLAVFGDPLRRGLAQARACASGVPDFFNDLERAACSAAPELELTLTHLRGQPGIPRAQVTGSGSCLFMVAANYGEADHAATTARTACDLPTRVVRAGKLV